MKIYCLNLLVIKFKVKWEIKKVLPNQNNLLSMRDLVQLGSSNSQTRTNMDKCNKFLKWKLPVVSNRLLSMTVGPMN